VEKTNNISLGTLYDFNKQLMEKQKPLTIEEIEEIKPKLEEWFNWQIDGYAMLLCREKYDFTVFHLYEKQNLNPPQVATNELIEALNNRGKILSIEKDNININSNGDVWEIWIKINKQVFAYYLFNCDDFIIQC